MATHSSVLAWRIPGTGEPVGLPSMGRTELDTTQVTAAGAAVVNFTPLTLSIPLFHIGEFLKLCSARD